MKCLKKEEQNIGEESSARITWKENTSQKKLYRLRYFFNISNEFHLKLRIILFLNIHIMFATKLKY